MSMFGFQGRSRQRLVLWGLLAGVSIAGCGREAQNLTAAGGPVATAGKSFTGSVHGGQQPVTGANVTLYAVGQAGDGSASSSLMTSAVMTDSNGNFVLTGNYSCPAPTTVFPGQVYLVASGGNPGLGAGKTNPQLSLMAALGLCSELSSSTYIVVNELTTVASVAALAPFMSSYAAVGSGSSDAAALDAAMTLVPEYVNTMSGTVPGAGLPSGYTAPTATLTTLANAIASCVNSSGGASGDGSACGKLFLYATDSGSVPTDTVGATLNILNNPLNDLTQIFGLVGASPPFPSGLTSAPSTWALPILASGYGTLTLEASSYSVNEDGGSLTLLVTRTEGDTGPVSVNYVTANGTATAATDYTATSGTLNWANGDGTAKTLTVPILDAGVYGGTRTFTVSLSTAAGGAMLGVTNSATVTIDDSDVQTSYYVATTGNDTTGTGTLAAPFATLARAQTAMRGGSIKVTQIESGTYYLTTALALTSSDSGETWEAAPGAAPVISGGVPVTGWTSIGGGIWTAPLLSAAGVDLEINGIRQYPAMSGWDPFRPYIAGWHTINSNATTSGQVMNVYAPDLTASAQTVGAIIEYTDTSRYTDWFGTVSASSTASDTVTINGYRGAPSAGQWRILGDYRDVTVPGQFGYNAATKQLYVMPTSKCGFGSSSVAVSAQLGSLITVSSVSNLTISGLTFRDTISPRSAFTDYSGQYNPLPLGTIQGNALTNSTLTNNKFVNVGNAISLTSSTGNSFNWNSFDQVGGSGIFLKTQSNNNVLQHNTMTSLGRINTGSRGIYIENGANITVDSNYLNGIGGNAVCVMANDTTSTTGLAITNNVFINTSQQTNDTSAIYLYAGKNPSAVNISSTISGNRVENTGALVTNAAGNYVFSQNRGLYMDEYVSGMTINNNVIEDNWQGILLCSSCKGNSASNNVVVLNPQPIYANYLGSQSSATGTMMLNGTTSIALQPSYFPSNVDTSTIVVQLSGTSASAIPPQFNVLADGSVIGSGTAPTDGLTVQQTVYRANLTPRAFHTVGIQLTNGANTGTATQSLGNLLLFVNNTLVSLAAGSSYGMQVLNTNSGAPTVSDVTFEKNIIYRPTGAGSDANFDFGTSGYTDPTPGIIDYNLLYQSLTKMSSTYGYTIDAHSIIANPLFLNPNIGDYTLQSNSPAYGLGFTASGVPLAPAASYPATAVSGCTVY